MNKAEKIEFVERFTGEIGSAPLVVVTEYRAVKVADSNSLRRRLEAKGLKLEVVKNTLVRRCVAGTPKEVIADQLTGMNGVIISGEDPIASAKAIREIIDPKGPIQIKFGYFDGVVLQPPEVLAVADLPSREDLLATLLSTLQEGPRQILGVIQGPPRDLLYLLKNYEAKLAEQQAGE
jgi:large subunit ribosomal protein L10